eukprot:Phypoly_transcript_08337.p1 GENE.Phypoly_transcript_08337~~Phypoly_transcript_08337.p1  ORF type:complete len:454 (+),score=33.18 Phypoly_transcript_08337:123-1484(+)
MEMRKKITVCALLFFLAYLHLCFVYISPSDSIPSNPHVHPSATLSAPQSPPSNGVASPPLVHPSAEDPSHTSPESPRHQSPAQSPHPNGPSSDFTVPEPRPNQPPAQSPPSNPSFSDRTLLAPPPNQSSSTSLTPQKDSAPQFPNLAKYLTLLAPVLTNRCNKTKIQSRAKSFNPKERPPTLVIYVYSETNHTQADNLKFFLRHGLCENCINVEYAIIINGATSNLTPKIPNQTNLQVFRRENVCGDFGAWEHFFKLMGPEYMQKYKRIMFLNDTVKGPFIDPTLRLLHEDLHFTDIFGAHLNEETRLVGSYINCGGIEYSSAGFSHVQTMSFMMDDVAFRLARDIFRCYKNRTETILHGEIGLSRRMIENGINIGSLLYAYKGVDFRCNDPMRLRCNNLLNPYAFNNGYFGMKVSLTEVIFVKSTYPHHEFELWRYEQWMERESDFLHEKYV